MLLENVELKALDQKLHNAQEKAQKFKEVMGTLPPTVVVTMMNKNKKMYSEMNQLRAEQQARAQHIKVLQDEADIVTTTLATTGSLLKQANDESVENIQTQITVETIDHFLLKELKVINE